MTPWERLDEMRRVLDSIDDSDIAPTPAQIAALIAEYPMYAKEIRAFAADVIELAMWFPRPLNPRDAPTEAEIEAEFQRALAMPPPRRRAARPIGRND